MNTSRFIAQFDSASAMLRAVAGFLHGHDSPLRSGYAPLDLLMRAADYLPDRVRDELYIFGGWQEAVPARHVPRLKSEHISRWVVEQYPRRRYPAVMIGSSNGAAVHLCCALGIPWLPQTFLIPIRRPRTHPDDMQTSYEHAQEHGRTLLEGNPDLQLHHMHDPNQDRLMVRVMDYFRVKRLRLGKVYTQFLKDVLEPGGTIFQLDCRLSWPTTQVAERYYFQAGAFGGATAEEYVQGGPRTEAFLGRHGSSWKKWQPPPPDGDRPEAEWGFEPALGADLAKFAERQGYVLRRITYDDPHDLSPLVADLYRRWYQSRGLSDRHLVVDSFLLLDPWWTLRKGLVPFWTAFAVEQSAERLSDYLDRAGPFDTIHQMLFSHGVRSIGYAPIDRWRSLLGRARKTGYFLGVNERAFPKDFSTFIHYHAALRRIDRQCEIPDPLSLSSLAEFVPSSESPPGREVELTHGR